MSASPEFEAFKLAVYTWASTQSGIPTIWTEQSGPRPGRPYATLRLASGAMKVGGQDNLRTDPATGEFLLNGPRTIRVTVQVYGEGALALLTRVRDSLDDPGVIESFDAQGIAVFDDGNPQNITEALESSFEERAVLEVGFEFNTERKSSIQSVDRITLNGNPIQV